MDASLSMALATEHVRNLRTQAVAAERARQARQARRERRARRAQVSTPQPQTMVRPSERARFMIPDRNPSHTRVSVRDHEMRALTAGSRASRMT